MTKKNWIILLISIAVVVLVLIPGITYLVQNGAPSGVTLSHDSKIETEIEGAARVNQPVNTPAPTVVPNGDPAQLSVADRQKLSVMKEIFISKNDNDPRMDSELVRLSPELKAAMVKTYQALPLEQRNERGTVAFLIGREIKSKEDVDFLKSVLMEKPCMSLGDCSKAATGSSPEDAHLEGVNETSANYPQLMANRQMIASYKKLVDQDASSPVAAQILQSLREALNSPNPRVADEARRALQDLGKQ